MRPVFPVKLRIGEHVLDLGNPRFANRDCSFHPLEFACFLEAEFPRGSRRLPARRGLWLGRNRTGVVREQALPFVPVVIVIPHAERHLSIPFERHDVGADPV